MNVRKEIPKAKSEEIACLLEKGIEWKYKTLIILI
jgi:hypothetical protein